MQILNFISDGYITLISLAKYYATGIRFQTRTQSLLHEVKTWYLGSMQTPTGGSGS